jgi:hypothetical protein
MNVDTGAVVGAGGTLPADPARFVAEAERITNERDVAGAVSVYSSDATLETITDGAHERHHGTAAIAAAWKTYLGVLEAGGFQLRKRLEAATGGLVVNEWRGSFRGGRHARGIECWHFDAGGQVGAHCLYSYFDVRPSSSPAQRARLFLAYPRLAVAFLREQHRCRSQPGA